MKHLRTSLKHIRRTPYQALIAICIMTLTFLSITFFAFLIFGSSKVIQYFESKPQLTAFFKDEAQQQDIDNFKKTLSETGKVASMRFVSKNEALEIYKGQNKGDPLLLDLVSSDFLPRSLEVSTYKIEDLASVAQIMRSSPLVMEGDQGVIYQKEVVSTLTKWTNGIRVIGIALIIILSLVSIFIMMTVIGFKVSQKREEIEIMRLLSATNWYIRWPFVLEGVIYGVVGTVIGWLIASAALLSATPVLEAYLKDIPVLPVSPLFLLLILAGEMLFAVVLGVLASSLAVLRYLK